MKGAACDTSIYSWNKPDYITTGSSTNRLTDLTMAILVLFVIQYLRAIKLAINREGGLIKGKVHRVLYSYLSYLCLIKFFLDITYKLTVKLPPYNSRRGLHR